MGPPRSPAQRKQDVLAKLAAQGDDVWVASASADGQAHLVPLSLAWDGDRVVLAAEEAAVTVRNVRASGRARLGLGPTRDVVMMDVVLDGVVDLASAPPDALRAYVEQAGWDPRGAGDDYVLLILRPTRIQAWREANEIAGRTLMRDGTWLV